MKIQEDLISFVINKVINERKNEFDFLGIDISKLENLSPFKKITYFKAIEILQQKEYRIITSDSSRQIEYGDDLGIEAERIITENSHVPIFVTNYPLKIKPFYVKLDPKNKDEGIAADLLAPYGFGEITSGGLREDNLEQLTNRMKLEGLISSDYEWYLDLRRYGSVPHGGFGLGIERLLRWILFMTDIKDTIPFPRTMSRINP
jgi:asparaginyl-tRNA synthetase